MAILLTKDKQQISYADYTQSNSNYCRFTIYLKLVSQTSTQMTIAAKVTYKHTSSSYYSGYQQRTTVTLNGVATNGDAFTPNTWGTTEKNCFTNCVTNSTDSNGWKNITITRSGVINYSFIDQGYNSSAGTYASGSGTVYVPDVWANINGTWKPGVTWVNIDGTWKCSSINGVKIGGTWTPAVLTNNKTWVAKTGSWNVGTATTQQVVDLGKTIRNPTFTCNIVGKTVGSGERANQTGFSATFGGESWQSYGYWWDSTASHTYKDGVTNGTNLVPYSITSGASGSTIDWSPWCAGWGDNFTSASVTSASLTITSWEELE